MVAVATHVGLRTRPACAVVPACALVATLVASAAGAADYHVSPSSDDAAGCDVPGPVADLRLRRSGADIAFTWSSVVAATSYDVRRATSLPDDLEVLSGSGLPGLTLPVPPGSLVFHVVSARNACGEGPR